jgi:beta-phosphoglucomutase-like phosphatase (HAD superfamily)
MTAQEADGHFLGLTFTDMQPLIERRLGRALEEHWKQSLVQKVIDAMAEGVGPIPGGVEALRATTALGLPWRVASNSSQEETMATPASSIGRH